MKKNKITKKYFICTLSLFFAFLFSFTSQASIAPFDESNLVYNEEKADITQTLPYYDRKEAGAEAQKPKYLYAGGTAFGVRIKTDYVKISEVTEFISSSKSVSPAKDSGLAVNDKIIKINDSSVNKISEILSLVEKSNGNPITVIYIRDGKENTASVTPSKDDSDGKFKIGLRLKDTVGGIGTVTFIDENGKVFGGLGHGIYESCGGDIIPVKSGTVCDVTIDGIIKGESGKPGELRGKLTSKESGILISNTECGTFGVFNGIPKYCSQKLETAAKDEVKTGEAYILCTLDNGMPQKYKIEITEIKSKEAPTKNFTVKVTDKELIEKTGGIVQGMSGSPIIQNGKLVGAVTHVLINDSHCGYGIFIENMLALTPEAIKK